MIPRLPFDADVITQPEIEGIRRFYDMLADPGCRYRTSAPMYRSRQLLKCLKAITDEQRQAEFFVGLSL